MNLFSVKTLHSFLQKCLSPKSDDEDVRRREFILNIILAVFLLLVGVGVLINAYDSFIDDARVYAQDALSLAFIITIFLFFLGLYVLSRTGHSRLASYFFVSAIYLLATYMGYRWGVDLPAEILFYVLAIIISGILVDTNFAFVMTVLCGLTLACFGYLQYVQLLLSDHYWKQQVWSITDTIMIVLIYALIATVSWLSNREIERSLKRARFSEAELRQERDLLEVRVKERTEELRQAEMERMSQAYRFVEFGRIAGGLFHDLANPLTSLSLNIENIALSHKGSSTEEALVVGDLAEDVERARLATLHMQKLMESMRRHIAQKGVQEYFSLDEEITQVARTLHSYAQDHDVELILDLQEGMHTEGDTVAFTQILTNLISNAIEAFPQLSPEENAQLLTSSPNASARTVSILLEKSDDQAHLLVRDTGPGISEGLQESVFDPFFSTKDTARGLGIGLSLAKRVVEKEFGGTLTLSSTLGKGTTFDIYFPLREPSPEFP